MKLVLIGVLTLSVSSAAFADVVELKTGQRVEGALKQATRAGVSIEAGGQVMTFPAQKVRAIYYGTAPAPPAGSSSSAAKDAVLALKDLRSATTVAQTYTEYQRRLADAKVKVNRALESADTVRIRPQASTAMSMYGLAGSIWSAKIQLRDFDWQFEAVRSAVRDIAPACRGVKTLQDRQADDDTMDNRTALVDGVVPALWSCASDKIAEAEKLLGATK